ncbi:MAG: 50S ribosomal protein L32e [Candidatus Nanohaloarchaea archaeon]
MSEDFPKENKHKLKKLKTSWRNPQGQHSKVRLKKKSATKQPKPGFRKPKETRGKHPSGYEEKLVHNTDDLEEIDNEKEAARIASKVGKKKRQKIIEKAENQNIKILNKGEE